jgi:two-component system cell cycle sensor histidine kinase/response regulator CckA
VYGIVKQTGGFIYVDPRSAQLPSHFLPRYIPARTTLRCRSYPKPRLRQLPARFPRLTRSRTAASDLTGQGTILLVEDEEGLRTLNAADYNHADIP